MSLPDLYPLFLEVLVKSKPNSRSIERHYEVEKTRMVKKWQEGELSGVFDFAIATAHLKSLAGEFDQGLAGLALPPSCETSEIPSDSQSSSEWNQDQNLEDSDDPISPSAEELRHCLDAHIKLQVLLVTRRAIPAKTVQDFIQILDDPPDSGKSTAADDSGNSTSHSPLSADRPERSLRRPGIYSSSLLKSINGATDVVALTERCLQPLLEFIHQAIFQHPVKSFAQWEGSSLKKFCDSLAEWCEYPVCQRRVGQFVDETLVQLWPCEMTQADNINLEYQLALLSSVNRHPDLCYSTLNKLVVRISKEIVRLIKNPSEPFDWQVSAVVHFLDFADLLFPNCLPNRQTKGRIRLPHKLSTRDLYVCRDHLPQEFKYWNAPSLQMVDYEDNLTNRLQSWHDQFSNLALMVAESADCPTTVYHRLLDEVGKIEILLHRSMSPTDCESVKFTTDY